MVLDVRRALRAGYDSLTSTDGLNVASVLLVFNLAFGTVASSFRQQVVASAFEPGPSGRLPIRIAPPVDWDVLALDLPVALLGAVILVGIAANEAIRFWGIRLFADEDGESLGDRLPVLLLAAGGLALVLFTMRGLLPLLWLDGARQGFYLADRLLVLTALVLSAIAVYLRQAIALTDRGVGGVVRHSLERFAAAPLATVGLLVILGLLGFAPSLSVSAAIVAGFGGQSGVLPWVQLGALALVAVVDTFAIAAVTDAYLQVRGAGDAA